MFWLRTGTISLVQGSKNAVATGVSFVGEVKPGEILMVGGVLSEIERVVNATTIQLTVAWAAASVANQPYAVIRNITGATNFDLMKSIEAFLTDRQRSMDEFVEWINGAYNEGPNANGTFPMTDRYGVTLSVKSPPRLKWESDQLVSSLNVTLASANTQLTAIGNQTIWANQILGYKNEAVAARDKAQKWAEELVDVAVEAGKYSAKHHATKAAASLTDVTARQSDVVTRQANVVTRQTDVTTRQTDVTAKQTDVIARQTNVIALEASALASKNSATTSAATATTKASEASTSASQAVVSSDTAEKWASEADNVVVSAGKYSAKHYAGKALVSETAAATSKTDAEAAKVLAQTAKTGADTAKTGADTAKTLADGSKTAAQAAKTAAETAQAAAEAARDIAVSSAAAVTGGLVDLGQVSLAGGVYPTKPATYSSFWKVTTAGTVAAIPYGIGDTLVYSKTMDEFYKIDNTESVSSINGKTGAVVLENRLGTPLASAATVTVGTAGEAESRHITGNVQITSLGVSVTGVKRELIFDAGLIIVHNATSLVCPGAVNLITAAGMVVDVICENGASGYWRVTNISHSGVSATELGYLDGVSSSIQTQINAKEPTIAAGTASQMWLGNKTWASVLSQVQGTLLTGYLVGTDTDLAATDTLLAAMAKIQGQLNARAPTNAPIFTGSVAASTIELGSQAGASNAFIDFHSGATPCDYDSRILAVAGTGNGTSANGTLYIVAGVLDLSTGSSGAQLVKVPTAAVGTNTTQAASTAYTVAEIGSRALAKSGGTMTGPIDLNRSGAIASGLSWYSPSYNTWQEYMGQAGVASQGVRGNVTPPVGSLVSSWGRRSYIENSAGYGWVFESAANGSTTPTIMMELSSVTGAAKFTGAITAPTFNGDLAGNASSATKLATARTINGVPFDGSANITIAAGETGRLPLTGGTLTGRLVGKNSGSDVNAAFYAASTGGAFAAMWERRGAPFHASIVHTGSSYAPALSMQYEYTGAFNGVYSLGHLATSGANPGAFVIHHLDGSGTGHRLWVFNGLDGSFTSEGAITAPTFSGSFVGNASTATKLVTARTINGVPFDGTANISIAAGETGRLPLTGGAVTGKTSFTKTDQVGWDTAAVEIGAQSGAAFIGFHRHSAFGGFFGLDTGNNFYGNSGLTMAGNITAYSDIRLKTDIEVISDALNKVCTLRGVTYERIDSGERQTGVIAQEVQAVLPEAVMVGADEDATLSVAYGNLVGLLIEAIKELKAEVDELKQGAK